MGEKASLYFPLGTNSITQLVSYRFEHSERRARKAASGAQRGSPRFQGTEGREERGEELGGGGGKICEVAGGRDGDRGTFQTKCKQRG